MQVDKLEVHLQKLRGKFVRSLNDLLEGRAGSIGFELLALCGQERI